MNDNTDNKNPKRFYYRGHEIKVWMKEKTADLLWDWGVVKLSKIIASAISIDAALSAAKKLIDNHLDKEKEIGEAIEQVVKGGDLLL